INIKMKTVREETAGIGEITTSTDQIHAQEASVMAHTMTATTVTNSIAETVTQEETTAAAMTAMEYPRRAMITKAEITPGDMEEATTTISTKIMPTVIIVAEAAATGEETATTTGTATPA